ncbi:R2-like ligand-binding oxidase [Hazenella sp. IB182357]|uniref:R2-like ligand binding oxidase n=1 Tax=Polycladospora coralii TaxID=2771432 RepID=A0A926NAK6_9BACL|nr:R2-like ligand-binding oxidase [Polycladospora coralii]MBD1373326.1 R2-like ligand-binding oxidase [Polycladospora coralii]
MRKQIISTGKNNIMVNTVPYRLYQKAKRHGIWNPEDIDFTQDQADWKKLNVEQKEEILGLLSQFQGGEEAVTLDLLPLMMVIAKEERLEEEMYLTTFLYEEAKHTDFFNSVCVAIGEVGDLSHFHTPAYKKVFYEILPCAMDRLRDDHSPKAIAEAATVYNMFVEGVLAETGYFAFYSALEKNGILPGLLEGIRLIQKDESRHIAYGTYLLQRLITEDNDIFHVVERKMEELTPLAIQFQEEGMNGNEKDAFGTPIEVSNNFMMKQLRVRMEILARAKGKTMEEIDRSYSIDID